MKIFVAVLLVGFGFWTVRAVADTGVAEGTNVVVITTGFINRLVAEARTNNPALKAADYRERSSELNAESIRSWEDPVATFGGSVYGDRGFNPNEDGNLIYGVEQKLPLWGRPKLSRDIAGAQVSTLQAQTDLRVQELRRDIAKSLLAAAFAERVVEIGEQDLTWLNVTASAVENKYRAGGVVIADTLEIQNEAAKRKNDLQTDRSRLAHERFTLNRLLNRPADGHWPSLQLPPVGPAIPLSKKLLSLSLQNEPKLKVLEQEIKEAQATTELTRRSRLPDVSLGVEGRQYSGDGEFRSGTFTLNFSIPWFNESKYAKDYQRDKERQKSAEEDREDQMLMVREQLHHLSVEMDAARREALLYSDEISPRASQALSSRVADWETGRGVLRDVLDARRTLLDSQLAAARATAEENGLLAELLVWTGLDSVEALAPFANESPIVSHENH